MIAVNDLGFGFPTFEQFQVMLREYEADPRYSHVEPKHEPISLGEYIVGRTQGMSIEGARRAYYEQYLPYWGQTNAWPLR